MAVLAGLALFVALSTAYWQGRSTFAIPYWDQWSAVFDYFRFRSGEIGVFDLFAQSNEHRIFFPRLIMFTDLALFGGRNAFNVLMSDVFQLAHLCLLLWMGRVLLARSFAGWAVSAFVTTAMLTGSQYENIYWGFQSQFVMVYLFASVSLAAAASLSPAGRTTPSAVASLACCVLSAVVATFSMANGLLVWPLVILVALERRAGRLDLSILLTVAVAAIAFYAHGYKAVAGHTPVTAALHRPLDAASYGLAYLGAVVAPQDIQGAQDMGLILAVLLVVLAARRIARRERLDRLDLFSWGAVLFVLLSAAVTTLGRFEFGAIQALSPRYVTPDAVLWSATAVLALKEVRAAVAVAAHGLCCSSVALLTAWLALADQPLAFERMADHEAKMRVASDAVVVGVTDPATLADLGPSAEQVGRVAAYLRPQALSVFDSREAGWMKEKLDRIFAVRDDPSCIGKIEEVRALDLGVASGTAVAGWAWNGAEGHGPVEMVFTDESGTVVGFAREATQRTEEMAAQPDARSDQVSWSGFASLNGGSDLLAYAVSDDARTACAVARWTGGHSKDSEIPPDRVGASPAREGDARRSEAVSHGSHHAPAWSLGHLSRRPPTNLPPIADRVP